MQRLLFLYLACLAVMPASAQILDDSTKQVYSAKTTLYIQESRLQETPVDTAISHFHHYTAPQRGRYLTQDLGLFSTATRPLFYQTPARIGTRLGIDPYTPYAFSPETMRYFDTKSPFLQVGYVQGTGGDQSIDVLFSRSVKKQWNFTLHYARENSNKQYGAIISNDPAADVIRFAVPVRFESKKKRYIALFHYSSLNHQGYETGGARTASGEINDTLFRARFVRAVLGKGTRSWQTQNTAYLYQQYRLDSAFTLFSRLKGYWQRDTYTDPTADNYEFYPLYRDGGNDTYFFSFDTGSEGTWYKNLEQESGIKGKWRGFSYEGFVRSRYFTYRSSRDGDRFQRMENGELVKAEAADFPAVRKSEFFVGGRLAYQTRKGYGVQVFAEYQPAGDYHLQGELAGKNFRLAGKSMLYSPALVQQRFLSNYVFWNNTFKRTLANDIEGELHFGGKHWRVEPAFRYVLLANYIFQERLSPQQSSDILSLLQPSLRFAVQVRRVHLNSQTHYTVRVGEDIIRQPALTGFGQIYCEDCFFRKRLQSQIGIEWYYKTAYFADAYAPYTKLFYVQSDVNIPAYAAADIFFNFRIKNLRGFLKLAYASQAPNNGYLVAPVYPAMSRQFVFGFNWMFFD